MMKKYQKKLVMHQHSGYLKNSDSMRRKLQSDEKLRQGSIAFFQQKMIFKKLDSKESRNTYIYTYTHTYIL